MKLFKPARQTSFYESFSDLIFCTLVLFIIMVMGLALKLEATVSASQKEVEKVIWKNRFSGGVDNTFFHYTHTIIGKIPYLVLVPDYLSSQWDCTRNIKSNNPELDLCQLALSEMGLLYIPIDKVKKLNGAITRQFLRGGIYEYEIGVFLYAILKLKQSQPYNFKNWSPETLLYKIVYWEDNRGWFYNKPDIIDEYDKWDKQGTGKKNYWAQKTIEPLKELADSTKEYAAFLKFTALDDKKIQVGSYKMSSKGFSNLLTSIKPGKGFYIEHVSSENVPSAPPEWVMKEVLETVGYGDRTLSCKGKIAVKRK